MHAYSEALPLQAAGRPVPPYSTLWGRYWILARGSCLILPRFPSRMVLRDMCYARVTIQITGKRS